MILLILLYYIILVYTCIYLYGNFKIDRNAGNLGRCSKYTNIWKYQPQPPGNTSLFVWGWLYGYSSNHWPHIIYIDCPKIGWLSADRTSDVQECWFSSGFSIEPYETGICPDMFWKGIKQIGVSPSKLGIVHQKMRIFRRFCPGLQLRSWCLCGSTSGRWDPCVAAAWLSWGDHGGCN